MKQEYRREGIGIALLNACETAVESWTTPIHDEVFAQVEEGNLQALEFFIRCGYQRLFVDDTCTKTVLDGALFMKEATVTKVMMRKILNEMGYFA